MSTTDPADAPSTLEAIPTSPASAELTTPRLPAWVRVLLPTVLFLPAASASMLALLIPGLQTAVEREDAAGVLAYAVICGFALAAYLLVSWLLMRYVDRRPASALGLHVGGRAVLALLAGIGLALVLLLPAAVAVDAVGLGREVEMPAGTLPPLGVLFSILLLQAFVLQGIGEEVLFRGYLMQSLSRRPLLAVVLSAVAFTIPHLASNGGQQNVFEHVAYLVVPFGFAIAAGFLAVALRSVWAAVGVHGGYHVANIVVVALGLPTGGVAVWLVSGAFFVLGGVVIGLLIPRKRWAQVRAVGPYAR